jgi:c-di-GMP-binding flagellar brake protein YcgR
LLSVKPEFEELVFDATALPGVERLDGRAGISAEAHVDAVWFRFEAGHAEVWHGAAQPAFRVRLPQSIARVQRRDSIRYPVPAMNPPVCYVPAAKHEARLPPLRLMDISVSGAGLLLDESRPSLKVGDVLSGCVLELPGIGGIQTDLVVMYASGAGDRGPRRLGCRFSNMLATSLRHLTHYVSHLERERLAAKQKD